jgi:hypothetical protein
MCLEERVDEGIGIEGPRVQDNRAAVHQNREVRVVRNNAVSAKAEGQWLTGTDQRAQRRGVRAISRPAS